MQDVVKELKNYEEFVLQKLREPGDSCLQPATRNSLGTTGRVFEDPPASDEPSSALLDIRQVWYQLIADLYLWIQDGLWSEPVCWIKTIRIVQYLHHDLPGSSQPGILPLMHEDFILKIVRFSCPGIKIQSCISINSSRVGRRISGPKYALVQVILRPRCCGSQE